MYSQRERDFFRVFIAALVQEGCTVIDVRDDVHHQAFNQSMAYLRDHDTDRLCPRFYPSPITGRYMIWQKLSVHKQVCSLSLC